MKKEVTRPFLGGAGLLFVMSFFHGTMCFGVCLNKLIIELLFYQMIHKDIKNCTQVSSQA